MQDKETAQNVFQAKQTTRKTLFLRSSGQSDQSGPHLHTNKQHTHTARTRTRDQMMHTDLETVELPTLSNEIIFVEMAPGAVRVDLKEVLSTVNGLVVHQVLVGKGSCAAAREKWLGVETGSEMKMGPQCDNEEKMLANAKIGELRKCKCKCGQTSQNTCLFISIATLIEGHLSPAVPQTPPSMRVQQKSLAT